MKKKLLIVGGSYGDIPIIIEAKKLGFYVITTGNNPNELGHKYSDEFHLRDFSKKEEILKLAEDLKIDAIVPSCHDLSMISSSYVAEKLSLKGFDSYETTINLHHKDRFRKIATELNLMVPKFLSFENSKEAKDSLKFFPFPCIVKPIDLGGGKGITILDNLEKVDEAIDYAFQFSKSKKIIVEEFVSGTLHSFSTFIKDQKVINYFGDNEFSSVNPYGVSTSTSPSKNFDNVKNILIEQTQKVAEAYKLTNGLFHLQYLLDGNTISIIEFTRRMPGDWYNIPVEFSIGINHAYWTLQGFLDGDFSELQIKEQKGFYSRHCLMASGNGDIEGLCIDNSIKNNIIKEYIWIDQYDKVTDFIYQKFGLYFLKYNSLQEMNEKTDNINKLIRVKIKNDTI
jgi:biotin carboxylase